MRPAARAGGRGWYRALSRGTGTGCARRIRHTLPLLLSLLLAGCGYFNSFYNAQRRFAEAERAQRGGDRAAATAAYRAAIEKAAISYRNHPDSRWADDALLLVGRARFSMGEYAAARAALGRVLEQSQDADVRALAALYLGAAHVALGVPDSALPALAQGLAQLDRDGRDHAFGRLWQGRALLAADQIEGWSALEEVAGRTDRLGLEAALELAAQGLARRDSARTARALHVLATSPGAETSVDSVLTLLAGAEQQWGPAAARAWLPAQAGERWGRQPRTRLGIRQAELVAAAGDTALALRQLETVVENATGNEAAHGRLLAARWSLARASRAEDLPRVRALLLPAVQDPGVQREVRRLRTLELLLERARDGQSAGLFAAAELARDTLGAPRLARELFLAYADLGERSLWAPKALLAALALTPDSLRATLLRRLEADSDNPYLAALHGRADSAAFRSAEERLGRAVAAVRADAAAAAASGDLSVARAITTLDSLRLAARADSLRIRCGALLDSLALAGIRGDSVRTACVRGDSAAVKLYLAMDTTLLRINPAADSTRRLEPRVARDTLL